MSETNKTADLILTSGDGALQAAFDIAAALPVAQTRDVARRVGGTFEMISTLPSVQLTLESVPINFVLFHNVAPFGGVTEGKRASMLCHDLPWGQPEKAWPRWIWLKKIDNDGPRLIDAAHAGDTVTVAEMLPAISSKDDPQRHIAAIAPRRRARPFTLGLSAGRQTGGLAKVRIPEARSRPLLALFSLRRSQEIRPTAAAVALGRDCTWRRGGAGRNGPLSPADSSKLS